MVTFRTLFARPHIITNEFCINTNTHSERERMEKYEKYRKICKEDLPENQEVLIKYEEFSMQLCCLLINSAIVCDVTMNRRQGTLFFGFFVSDIFYICLDILTCIRVVKLVMYLSYADHTQTSKPAIIFAQM